MSKNDYTSKIVAACRLIEKAQVAPTLDALAKSAAMSKFHFHRLFKEITGVTPKAYAKAHRTKRARKELRKQSSVTRAIYGAGFRSNGRFYAESAAMLGMTPKRFRKGGIGETIRFAVGECSLGSILVAASEQGVCTISLGDDPNQLVHCLQDDFPRAELLAGDKKFEQLVARVVGLIETPEKKFDLPLDVRGTVFQRRVWNALQKIPRGSTLSYSKLAKSLRSPKGARAVAKACASNKIAIAIPCHRVVRNDGQLSGYRWGVERKQALLDLESSHEQRSNASVQRRRRVA